MCHTFTLCTLFDLCYCITFTGFLEEAYLNTWVWLQDRCWFSGRTHTAAAGQIHRDRTGAIV